MRVLYCAALCRAFLVVWCVFLVTPTCCSLCLRLSSLRLSTLAACSYWSAMRFCPTKHAGDPSHCDRWMTYFHSILKKPLPEASEGAEPRGQPTAVADRNEWPVCAELPAARTPRATLAPMRPVRLSCLSIRIVIGTCMCGAPP